VTVWVVPVPSRIWVSQLVAFGEVAVPEVVAVTEAP
jgi:hypothetical protein